MNYEENARPEGRLEMLEAQTDKYLAEAPDRVFADYLIKLKERIHNQKFQVELLQDELDRSYQMYQRRMGLAGEAVSRPVTMVQEAAVQQLTKVVAESEPVATDAEANPQYIDFRNVQPVQAPVKKHSGGAEFMIGTVILSVVGGAFILTALVMLGMHFVNGLVKGMCLYAGALLLLGISELLVHRKWPKLAAVFSAIGIGGLYLSTVLNYLSLHNFGMMMAIIITLIITLFVLLLSRKRESLVYRILGLIASYLCLMTVGENITTMETWVLTGIILLINILCVVVPMHKYITAFHVTHMWCNLLFAYFMDWRLNAQKIPLELRLVLTIGFVLIMQLLLILQMRYEGKEAANENKVDSTPLKVAYCIGIVGFSSILREIFRDNMDTAAGIRYGIIAIISIICIAAVIALRKHSVKWYPYYLLNLACISIGCYTDNEVESVTCLIVLLAIAKLLSLWRIPSLKLSDAFLTTLTCMCLLGHTDEIGLDTYILLAGVVFSVFFISQWQTYFELLLVYTLGFFAAAQLGTLLQLPVFVGLLFVGILLFNNVPRFSGKNILVYNGLALAGEIVCFLLLINPIYQNAFITYLCMLVFGVATIALTFQEKYHMNLKNRNIIMAVFLTYMALVVRTTLPVINSILLMIIALVCVGMGFAVKEKAIRIYGLVLSLIICGKIVLYDYVGAATLQKMILFLSVGVIALIISGIYIILEKKNHNN